MSLKKALGALLDRGAAGPAERPPAELGGLLSIDIGCGAKKRPGYQGVDIQPLPGVDHVVDFSSEPLPFADGSVGQVFSSHCIEHLREPLGLLREVTRVCAHGARVELWAPYSWYGDAHFYEHVSYFNERQFLHMGTYHPQFWSERMGGGWVLHQVTYALFDHVLADLKANRVDVGFALRYYKDVSHEMGLLIEIDKRGTLEHAPPQVSYTTGRDHRRRSLAGPARARALRALGYKASSLMGRLAT